VGEGNVRRVAFAASLQARLNLIGLMYLLWQPRGAVRHALYAGIEGSGPIPRNRPLQVQGRGQRPVRHREVDA